MAKLTMPRGLKELRSYLSKESDTTAPVDQLAEDDVNRGITNYKRVFHDITSKHTKSDHIYPTPRSDFQKVYVFLDGLSVDQLRNELEAKIGVEPDIPDAYAINSILYVLPTEMPEAMPLDIKNAATQYRLGIAAVFIRGATNIYCTGGAQSAAGELLDGALRAIQREYWSEHHNDPQETYKGLDGWRFGEARRLLNTRNLISGYDKELADMEYSF